MAYFKISLLTPRFESNSTIFIEDTITEFFSQQQEYNSKNNKDDISLRDNAFSTLNDSEENFLSNDISDRKNSVIHTYNEKFSRDQNAQKTLSFDLDKYYARENEWYENPFANNISIGSQILLTDQYFNEYLFTVTSIKYNIKENNITYNISCQDSFSYQMTRQNDGYTIENDSSEEDFIGAKIIDWWVINKIIPECYLTSYDYISCEEGLYENTKGEYKVFNYRQDLYDVKRIIKDAHKPPVYKNGEIEEGKENDIDFFETFPFSCSGSNVDAALIALGAEVKMQINTFEHAVTVNNQRTKYFNKYFWFEPIKNTKRIGLTYSPTHNISNFNLTHQGQSLTTILNVDGPTYDDKLVTLIPTIPSFFHQYFHSLDWENSAYTESLFSSLCKKQLYKSSTKDDPTIDNGLFKLDINEMVPSPTWPQIIDIPIYNHIQNGIKLFKRKTLFDYYNFYGNIDQDASQVSGITLQYTKDDDIVYYFSTPRSDSWQLIYKENGNEYIYNQDVDLIDNDALDKEFYIRITTNLNEVSPTILQSNISISDVHIFLTFYRDVTEEEIEFAKIADQCPWLENKLIDFSYFKEINIISNEEYSSLINILYNDLRIINGKLMFYAQNYYESLRKRTEILADLINNLDSLGASCQASVIDPIAQTGAVKDLSYFENAYKNVWTISSEKTAILGYDDLLNEYFYKYSLSEQRFLKNIYNFRRYFNEINLNNDNNLYRYTLSIENPLSLETPFYSFKNGKFVSIKDNYHYYSGYTPNGNDTSVGDYGRCLASIFEGTSNGLFPIQVASKDKWAQELYLAPFLFGKKFYCDPELNQATYKTKTEYAKIIFLIPVKENETEEDIYYYQEEGNPNQYYLNTFSTINATTISDFNRYNRYIGYEHINANANLTEHELPWIGTYKISFAVNNRIKDIICKANGLFRHEEQLYIKIQPTTYEEDLLSNLGLTFSSTNIEDLQEIALNTTISAIYAKWTEEGSKRYSESSHEYEDTPVWSTNAQLLFKGEEVGYSEIINNWMLTTETDNLKRYYLKQVPVYKGFNENDFDSACFNMLKYFNPYYIATNVTDKFLNSKTKEEELRVAATEDYYAFLPLTEIYRKMPVYQITAKDDKYSIRRLNLKGQSFDDYLKYMTSSDSQYNKEVINPFNSNQMQYQLVSFVTPSNEANYFRRVRLSNKEIGVMTALTVPVILGAMATCGGVLVATPEIIGGWLAACLTNSFEKSGALSDTDLFQNGVSKVKISSIEPTFSTYKYFCPNEKHTKHRSPFYTPSVENYNLHDKYIKSMWGNNVESIIPNPMTIEQYNTYKNLLLQAPLTEMSYNKDTNQISYNYSLNTIIDQLDYKLFGYVYENLENNKNLYYQDEFYVPLKKDDRIYSGTSYGILRIQSGDYNTDWTLDDIQQTLLLLRQEPSWNNLEKEFLGRELSTTIHYPITRQIQPLDLTTLNWKTSWNVEDLLYILGFIGVIEVQYDEEHSTEYILKATYKDGINYYIVIYRHKNFIEDYLYDNIVYNDIKTRYSSKKYYDKINNQFADFSTITDLTKGYYILPDISKDKIPANSSSEIGGEESFSMYSAYYDIDGKRIYTIEQLKNSSKSYYYFMGVPIDVDNFSDQINKFNVEIYKCTPEWDEHEVEGEIKRYLKNVKQELLQTLTEINFKPGVDSTTIKVGNDTINITKTCVFLEQIVGLTNGTFWNRYKNRLDQPLLFEQAASIEAQLTLYWEQAFTASKYCEYFLPEHWTMTSNQVQNTFFRNVIILDGNQNAKLSDYYLPVVQIYKDENRNSILPYYKFTRINSLNYTIDKINQMDFISASSVTNNTAIANMFAVLNEDSRDWYAEKIGEKTYYYSTNGGKTWPELFNLVLKLGSSFKEMSGLYVMTYKKLKESYLPKNCSMYNKLTDQHNAIWKKIYKKYGFLVLENSYKNETATNSTDLLKVAQYYFKDKMQPERGYSISIIDSASLDNYNGAEIYVGDGIKINASQYYNEYDKVYESLSRYLFITNLNYTLRNPSNIDLTVNDIKYEEGIIKRLAKLIK